MVRTRRHNVIGVKGQQSFHPDFNPRTNDPPGRVLARASGLIPRVNLRLVVRPHAGQSDCLLAVLIS